jgi:hypothetical protein
MGAIIGTSSGSPLPFLLLTSHQTTFSLAQLGREAVDYTGPRAPNSPHRIKPHLLPFKVGTDRVH